VQLFCSSLQGVFEDVLVDDVCYMLGLTTYSDDTMPMAALPGEQSSVQADDETSDSESIASEVPSCLSEVENSEESADGPSRSAQLCLVSGVVLHPTAGFQQVFGSSFSKCFLPKRLLEPFSFFTWVHSLVDGIQSGGLSLPHYSEYGPTPIRTRKARGTQDGVCYNIKLAVYFPMESLRWNSYIKLQILSVSRIRKRAAWMSSKHWSESFAAKFPSSQHQLFL